MCFVFFLGFSRFFLFSFLCSFFSNCFGTPMYSLIHFLLSFTQCKSSKTDDSASKEKQ